MSRTKVEVKKQAKKHARDKRNRKIVNIRNNNLGPEKWALQVFVNGTWCEARRFRRWDSVLRHRDDTERRRKAGEVIVPGKVFSVETGKEVMSIEGSDKKGILPDKMAGNEQAADKAKPGFLKRMMGDSGEIVASEEDS